jgi:hypothetical protein
LGKHIFLLRSSGFEGAMSSGGEPSFYKMRLVWIFELLDGAAYISSRGDAMAHEACSTDK